MENDDRHKEGGVNAIWLNLNLEISADQLGRCHLGHLHAVSECPEFV